MLGLNHSNSSGWSLHSAAGEELISGEADNARIQEGTEYPEIADSRTTTAPVIYQWRWPAMGTFGNQYFVEGEITLKPASVGKTTLTQADAQAHTYTVIQNSFTDNQDTGLSYRVNLSDNTVVTEGGVQATGTANLHNFQFTIAADGTSAFSISPAIDFRVTLGAVNAGIYYLSSFGRWVITNAAGDSNVISVAHAQGGLPSIQRKTTA